MSTSKGGAPSHALSSSLLLTVFCHLCRELAILFEEELITFANLIVARLSAQFLSPMLLEFCILPFFLVVQHFSAHIIKFINRS